MKKLIIAEKPSVAADIAKSLGGFDKKQGHFERADAIISSGIGHLVELSTPKGEDPGYVMSKLPYIPSQFVLAPVTKTRQQLTLLGELLQRKDVGTVINACDAGREGELIFRYILMYHRCQKPVERMWLQSMTADAIRAAWSGLRPGQAYDNLFDAAISRSEADWLIGANGSRASSIRRSSLLGRHDVANVGRVMTPTLALLADRRQEIEHFVPKDYFGVELTLSLAAGNHKLAWFDPAFTKDPLNEDARADRMFDRARADAIAARCKGRSIDAVRDEAKRTKQAPPKLFDLTTLQREANQKFGFSASDTLAIAQALYETHKVLTYPRTDASCLPEDYIPTAKRTAKALEAIPAMAPHAQRIAAAGWIQPSKDIFNNAKISDHFAIIPTGEIPSGLTPPQQKIYDLVVRRFLAVFHPAAEFDQTTRIAHIGNDRFKASGKVLVSEGWMAVYGKESADDDATALPALAKGEQAQNHGVSVTTHKTKAPSHFTEASLLLAMESAGKKVDDEAMREAMSERGLGTPATRAAVIEKLLSNRDGKGNAKEPYVTREKKNLVATIKGMDLIRMLRDTGVDVLTQPHLTGEWEYKLKQMEKGKVARRDFMKEIVNMAGDMVGAMRHGIRTPESLGVPCPKCGGTLAIQGVRHACGGCEFSLPSRLMGREMQKEELVSLIREGRTPLLNGFVSSKKKPFDAILVLRDGKLEFEFPERAPAPDTGKLAASLPPCPCCGKPMAVKAKSVSCTGCDLVVWHEVAGHRLRDHEIQDLLTKKETGVITGFVSSKTKKSFSATLRIDGTKVAFEFANDRKYRNG